MTVRQSWLITLIVGQVDKGHLRKGSEVLPQCRRLGSFRSVERRLGEAFQAISGPRDAPLFCDECVYSRPRAQGPTPVYRSGVTRKTYPGGALSRCWVSTSGPI